MVRRRISLSLAQIEFCGFDSSLPRPHGTIQWQIRPTERAMRAGIQRMTWVVFLATAFAAPSILAAAATQPTRAGPDWWSLQPLKQVQAPESSVPGSTRDPIDSFVLQRLET